MCDALRDLVPFVRFKNVKKTHEGILLLGLEPATLLNIALPHGLFSCFLNCANGIKSHKASHVSLNLKQQGIDT